MTRTSDVAMTADARCEFLRAQSADLCISIHHDGNNSASAHGGSFFYSTPFSRDIMNFVYNRTAQQGIYRQMKNGWHYFYMARVTSCPVVLTENGFMSNLVDCQSIANEAVNTQKAKAITAGVLDHFNRFIQPPEPEVETPDGPNAPITPVEPTEPPEDPKPEEPVEEATI